MTLNRCLSTEVNLQTKALAFFLSCIDALELSKDKVTEERDFVVPSKVIENPPKATLSFQISDWYDSLKKSGSNSDDVAKWENLAGYKNLEGTIVIPNFLESWGTGRAILTLKYEKINSDIAEPKFIMDTFIDFVMQLDENLFSDKHLYINDSD